MKRVAWVALAGCGGVEQGYEPVPPLDEEAFVESVGPVLEERCANPSCHGRPERPLAVYAPRRFRADATRTFLDEPLTSEELRHNYDRACGFAAFVDAPIESLLLRKPLGRAYHGGGIVLAEGDAETRVIEDWLWSE
ncbi:MAG: hypothetical protein AABZ30_02300 [Myxococcota bacterium]